MNKAIVLFMGMLLLTSLACRLVSAPLEAVGVMRGSGQIVRETRQVSGFDEIDVCCGMQLILTQGDSESLEIEADDNLLPEILSSVSGGKLIIRFRDDMGGSQYLPSQPVRLRVSAREVHHIDISGGGSVEVEEIQSSSLVIGLSGGSRAALGSVVADTLDVGMSGGGSFSAQELDLTSLEMGLSGGSNVSIDRLNAERLKFNGSGGGQATVAGSVTDQEVNWSGGGRYRAGDLESETAILNMSGGGSVTLWVNESLDANLSGGASGEYYGRPVVNQDVSGGGSLKGLGDK